VTIQRKRKVLLGCQQNRDGLEARHPLSKSWPYEHPAAAARRGGHNGYSAELTGGWGEGYLTQVLNALAVLRDPKTLKPWARENLSRNGLYWLSDPTPDLHLGRLVVACHSAGGRAMRNLVGSLGRYKGNLAECWGFDCLYGQLAAPDDATFWYNWANGSGGRPLYISYGPSTVPQSVKLYLMAEGIATERGARRQPEGPVVERLNVTLGLRTSRYIDDLMELDNLLLASTPAPRRPARFGNQFVELAANNLRKNASWVADEMEFHYRVARRGLLERLNAAPFL
jgi:hypothetical protein